MGAVCSLLAHALKLSVCAGVLPGMWCWVDRVRAADRLIAAASLDTVDGSGKTLVAEIMSSSGEGDDATLGSGAFGKVRSYGYHGAAVAVKELKSSSPDAESIGTSGTLRRRAISIRECGWYFVAVCGACRRWVLPELLLPRAGCET